MKHGSLSYGKMPGYTEKSRKAVLCGAATGVNGEARQPLGGGKKNIFVIFSVFDYIKSAISL